MFCIIFCERRIILPPIDLCLKFRFTNKKRKSSSHKVERRKLRCSIAKCSGAKWNGLYEFSSPASHHIASVHHVREKRRHFFSPASSSTDSATVASRVASAVASDSGFAVMSGVGSCETRGLSTFESNAHYIICI